MNTLLLDRTAWDLVIDSLGNIAMAMPPYAFAQDVASAIKLFLGELFFDQTKGVPYFEDVLGRPLSISILTGFLEKAALTVPGVVSAQCSVISFDNRTVTAEVRFIDENGVVNVVNV